MVNLWWYWYNIIDKLIKTKPFITLESLYYLTTHTTNYLYPYENPFIQKWFTDLTLTSIIDFYHFEYSVINWLRRKGYMCTFTFAIDYLKQVLGCTNNLGSMSKLGGFTVYLIIVSIKYPFSSNLQISKKMVCNHMRFLQIVNN